MENKINQKFILMTILLLNFSFVTIPYFLKEFTLQRQINQIQKIVNTPKIEKRQDYYKIYDKFNELIEKMQIKPVSKTAEIEQNYIKITLVLNCKTNELTNFLKYVQRQMPKLGIIHTDMDLKQNDHIIEFYQSE